MQENTRGGSAVLVYLAALETEAERDRFQALYERYRGLMFHRAMLLLRNESDAEDAVHQAFLAILEHFEKISSIDCPKTRAYVVIIAESKAVDLLRARKRLASEAELEALPGPEIPLPGGSDLAGLWQPSRPGTVRRCCCASRWDTRPGSWRGSSA